MATYAIGDLQGCWQTLDQLLNHIKFRPKHDKLWFVGDLVNRGEGSLECLRFVYAQGKNAVTVLGNHDLHLLAVAEGIAKTHHLDTLESVLHAHDADKLLFWLRQQKLLHIDGEYAMVHAGLMPQWSWATSLKLSHEIEFILRGKQYKSLLENMYGNQPASWDRQLSGFARLRFALNTMTRMRVLTPSNSHQLQFKGELAKMPDDLRPWFTVPSIRRRKRTIIAGHWSALGFYQSNDFIGIDTGCVWGQTLTAVRLEDRKIFQMPSQEKQRVDLRD